jgi:hypothetical protein
MNDVWRPPIPFQGEAYRAANMKDEAKAFYSKLISDYFFYSFTIPKVGS